MGVGRRRVRQGADRIRQRPTTRQRSIPPTRSPTCWQGRSVRRQRRRRWPPCSRRSAPSRVGAMPRPCCTRSSRSRPSSRSPDPRLDRRQRSIDMTQSFSRRELIKWAGAGAGAAAVGGGVWLVGRDDHSRLADTGDSSSPTAMSAGSQRARTASTRPPSSAPSSAPSSESMADVTARRGRRRTSAGGCSSSSSSTAATTALDARPIRARRVLRRCARTAVGEADVIHLSDTVGLHKNARARSTGAVWRSCKASDRRSPTSRTSRCWPAGGAVTQRRALRSDTGFLGRLADAIGDPAAAAVAVSIGSPPRTRR